MTQTAYPRQQRLLTDLEGELRRLLGGLLTSLSDLLNDNGNDTLRRFLADAPVELCLRVADTWTLASELGMNPVQLMPRFSPEEQFLLELVTAIYAAGRQAPAHRDGDDLGDLCELVGLLDEAADADLFAAV